MKNVILVSLGCLIVSAALLGDFAFAEVAALQQAEELFVDRNYAEAAAVLQELIDKGKEENDYLIFLMGNSFFYREQYEEAIKWYEKLIAEFPESSWKQKTLFKQADCFMKLKQFKQAEDIYEREVVRLVSPERKEQIAEIYLNFAEEYFSGKWVKRKGQQGIEEEPVLSGVEEPDYGKAKTFYELALQMEIGKAKAEEVHYQTARCFYELSDYAGAINTLKQIREDYPEGKYLTKVIYYLGLSYLKQGQFMQARRIFRDFVEDYPDDPDAPEAAFLISRAYNIPNPELVEDLELGVKALQDFIEIYPENKRISQAEYEIGLSYYNAFRYEDAVVAFKAYIKKYEGKETHPSPLPGEKTSPFDGLPLARYYLGRIYQQQWKYQDAIAVWQEYLQKHPSHNQWSEVQRQIIETEYLIADKLFFEEQYEAARTAWEQFLSDHPLDPRNPQIMYRIGETYINLAKVSESSQDLYQEAIAQWKRTVSKYPNTDPASRAQYEIGIILETQLLKFEEAFEAYKRVTWGSYYPVAQERIREMQAKRLTVLTERAFRADETPTLKVTTRNIETLTLKMYKVDLETYFRKMQTTDGVDKLDIALIDPDQTWQATIPSSSLRTGEGYERFREFETDMNLAKVLKPSQGLIEPGAYLVTCSEENVSGGTGYEATTFVLITDLDIIVKTTKRDVLIFAQNMRTGEPYPGVKFLLSDGKKVFFEGTTKEDGVFHETLKELKDVPDVRVFAYDDTHYASSGMPGIEESMYDVARDARAYLYTDRPVYRPGQQVHIRGILREADDRGILSIPKLPVLSVIEGEEHKEGFEVWISGPGRQVFQEKVSLNEFGSFSIDFTLSTAAPTGDYSIIVPLGEYEHVGRFRVEEYKLEKVKLTIETERDVYFRGETINGTIRAEYYYGEPIKEKKISYSLANLEVHSAVTNERGEVPFFLSTRDFVESGTLTLRARLDDENVWTSKTVWLATRGFSCEVSTIRNVYLVEEDIEVSFTVKDPAGNPLEKTLSFGVFKRRKPYGAAAEVKIEEQPVTTDKNGTGKTLIRIAEGGNYILRAEGEDRFGNPVSGQTELFISGKDDDIKLRIITDAEEFKVGEQPEVTLFSRASEGLGLLTYEAQVILSYQIINIRKEKNPLQLSVTTGHVPNFTLAVAQMDGNKFHQAKKEFSVFQELNVRVTPEKEEFLPGETISVVISTTDQHGNPVPAEISLAMVDEALYAQYKDEVPPIREYFKQWRKHPAQTDSSCIFRFIAETKEIVSEILDEERRIEEEKREMLEAKELAPAMPLVEDIIVLPESQVQVGKTLPGREDVLYEPSSAPKPLGREEIAGEFLKVLREYFPETGYWNPGIVIDADGKAVVKIELPDSTTEWRFTSRGITRETLVGETTAGITAKKPLFVDMKVPAVFTEGDKVALLASVHNYSGDTQDVRMTFTGSMDSEVIEQQEQQVTAEDQSVLETEYRLDLSRVSQLTTLTPLFLEFAATSKTLQDRIKREIPVSPWGIEYVTTKSGTLQDDRKIEISLPGDRNYLYREMSLLLNPSLDRTLVDLASDLPWLFKAPSSASIHEATVILNALRSLDQSVAEPAFRDLKDRLRVLLTEIALRQNQDGGWNWTGSEPRSDLFVSADAVVILTEANHQGYPIQLDVLKKGIAYLQRAFQSVRDNDIKAYLLYALAVAKDVDFKQINRLAPGFDSSASSNSIVNEVDFAHVNRLYRERNSLHTTGLALLTLIYSRLNRPEIAAELNALLQNRAKIQRDEVTGEQIIYWPSDSPYFWLQGDVDTTTLALLAVQQAEPASNLIAGSVEWIYTQRQWIGWGSMRTNARVSSALLEYFSKTRYAANRYILQVIVNGQTIEMMTVDSERNLIVLEIPAEILKDYGNTVVFEFEGRGSLNYVCILKGTSRDIRKTQAHYEVRRYYEPAPLVFKGKEIPRGFKVLDGSYSTWRNKLTQIPLGNFGRVTLQHHRREYERDQPYKNHRLIIEEPIPAGCTVLEQSIQGGLLDYEIRDGKILFYLNNARYGTISYDLYGYLPGEYKVLPAKIQSPYNPGLLDYGTPYNITVLKRGQAVTEEYKKTPDELYYYGKALFEEKRYAEARPLLQKLFDEFRLKSNPYKDTVRMLMYIAIAENNPRDIVQYFEILKEKYPDLVLSFEDIVRVGKAYRDIQEYERAVHVFKATVQASFLKDVQVSGTLEAQGEFMPSVEYTRDLLMEYPDIPTTETSFYALAQLLYTEAVRSEVRNEVEYRSRLSKKELLNRTIGMFRQFLVRYPENPIVDEVSFSLANAYIDLEDFEAVIDVAKRFQQRYPKSPYFSGYQYIEGYANFELERYEESLTLCKTVATGKYPDKNGKLIDSDHKDLAIYITGQIYHSMGKPEQAIAEYEKVKDQFPDAKEAIAYFTRKKLKLDEVTTFTPKNVPHTSEVRGTSTTSDYEITLHYRNVQEVNILAYRVDLMKLYLLQKNLNNITNINLAGIAPYFRKTLQPGQGKDYADKEYRLTLPLEKEGAYLVVAKEAELDTSGMVLLSFLKMEVEEDIVSGRVRVNVMNAGTGKYENKVHVKVIGSHDTEFVSGETDLRGIFIADNIRGTATVIARKGDQYAFYRGKAELQPSDVTIKKRPILEIPADMRSQATQRLRDTNIAIQQQSESYLRGNLYQNKQIGVEVQSAY